MKLVLGVDGGGTKTAARLLSEGPGGRLCLLASGYDSGSNPYSVGWPAAHAALTAAITAATASAETKPTAAVIAVAGCASDEARDRLTEWARQQGFAESVTVVADTEPILAGVPAGSPAIGLIAGTGSSALVRDASGTTTLVGGWGYLIDDGGSGYALGRAALRHVAYLRDTQQPLDPLADALLEQAGVTAPDQLKAKLYGAADPRGWAAQLAKLVLRLAEGEDRAAQAIVDVELDHLAQTAEQAAARLASDQKPLIRLAGGLLTGSPYYRRGLTKRLVAAGWEPDQIALAPDGAIGCALLACQQ